MISGDRSILHGKRGAFFYTLEEFSRHWERIDVICPNPGNKEIENRSVFGNVFFHPSPWSLLSQPKWIKEKGQELIEKYQHDVMTVHEYPPFYNGWGALKLKKITNIPTAIEIHHIIGWPRTASLQERIGRTLSKFFFPYESRRFDAIRVVNQSVWDALVSWNVDRTKLRVVPSIYLDTEFFEIRRERENITKKYDLAFCGRIVANKGLLTILETVAKMPNVTLLVIGDGPLKNRAVQKAKDLQINDRVEFKGWLATRKSVTQELLSARIFVMNSTSEGGPRVAVEAMALGLPVIATRVGVMPDFIEDGINGFITDGSSKDLQRIVSILLSDERLRTKVGEAASNFDFKKYNRQDLIQDYARFLSEMAPIKSQ